MVIGNTRLVPFPESLAVTSMSTGSWWLVFAESARGTGAGPGGGDGFVVVGGDILGAGVEPFGPAVAGGTVPTAGVVVAGDPGASAAGVALSRTVVVDVVVGTPGSG